MGFGNIVFAVIGFSTSFLFCVPNLKRRQRKQLADQKLKFITEALEAAEERVVRFEERHDRILSQICGSYLTHPELSEALAGAREAMNEALKCAVDLRRIQFEIISSFPDAFQLRSSLECTKTDPDEIEVRIEHLS